MIYAFYNNGTYRKIKSPSKKNLDADWYLIDISTDRKGPLFTVVKDINLDFKNDNINIAYDITYAPYDVPFDENTTIHNKFNITTLGLYYSIYPLIKQVFGYNNYRDIATDMYSCINFNSIDIQYKNSHIHLDEGVSDKCIKKTFEYMNMTTNVSDISEYGFDILDVILLRKKKWTKIRIYDEGNEYYNLLDMKWDKIIIPIPELESCYVMTYEDFFLFTNAYNIQISVSYDYYGDDMIFETNIYTLTDYLYACIYLPQLFLMERHLYDEDFSVIIKLEVFNKSLELKISQNEIDEPKNTCIYDLFRKLIRLQL